MSSTGSTDPTDAGGGATPDGSAAELDGRDAELRAARRTVALLGVALAAAALGVLSLVVGARGDDGAPDLSRTAPGVGATSTSLPGADRIGPPPGAEVPDYVAGRQEAITTLEGAVTAVVSLTGYSTPAIVEDLVADVDLDSYLVALPGDRSRRTDDVDELVDRVVADAEGQLAELESIAPTVADDDPFARFYAEEIERYRELLDEADREDVVFGFVVTGQAADLRALGSRASVRLVDARTGTLVDDGISVSGLRPEERTTTGEPEFRP